MNSGVFGVAHRGRFGEIITERERHFTKEEGSDPDSSSPDKYNHGLLRTRPLERTLIK